MCELELFLHVLYNPVLLHQLVLKNVLLVSVFLLFCVIAETCHCSVCRFHAEESGEFQFCIDNTFSRFSNKVVFFELVLYGVEEEDTDDGDADTEENIYEIKLDDIRVSGFQN